MNKAKKINLISGFARNQLAPGEMGKNTLVVNESTKVFPGIVAAAKNPELNLIFKGEAESQVLTAMENLKQIRAAKL